MAPKKNEPAKDKEDKDDATPAMCTDEEVFGTEEEQRQRAAEKRKQALDITGTPGPERKTKLMTVASYDDFFDERDGSQENISYSDFTSRSWTIHWFK
eukprot:jgi/Tetstr1/456029/TSEL_042805.t1